MEVKLPQGIQYESRAETDKEKLKWKIMLKFDVVSNELLTDQAIVAKINDKEVARIKYEWESGKKEIEKDVTEYMAANTINTLSIITIVSNTNISGDVPTITKSYMSLYRGTRKYASQRYETRNGIRIIDDSLLIV